MSPDFVSKCSKGGWYLRIWVQPNAKKTEISGVIEGKLKVRISAPPVDNKANECLLKFLLNSLSLKKSDIELVKGEKGRDKLFWVKREKVNWESLL